MARSSTSSRATLRDVLLTVLLAAGLTAAGVWFDAMAEVANAVAESSIELQAAMTFGAVLPFAALLTTGLEYVRRIGRWFSDRRQDGPKLDRALQRRLESANERDEFEVHFQPIHEVSTGRLVGAEALMRWDDPERGLVPAGEYLDQLEGSGLIVDVGQQILRAAVLEAAYWDAPGRVPIDVHVNISVEQLRIPGFSRDVLAVLDDVGLPPERLCLEVSEAAIDANPGLDLDPIRQLAERGVVFALDRFGGGGASLDLLRQAPFAVLKIDGSLVAGVASEDDEQRIVAHLVKMADDLGLESIAENVETVDQLAALDAMGCTKLQGYLVGRPQTMGEFRGTVGDWVRKLAPPASEREIVLN